MTDREFVDGASRSIIESVEPHAHLTETSIVRIQCAQSMSQHELIIAMMLEKLSDAIYGQRRFAREGVC